MRRAQRADARNLAASFRKSDAAFMRYGPRVGAACGWPGKPGFAGEAGCKGI